MSTPRIETKTAISLLKFFSKNKEYSPQNGIDGALADAEVRNIIEGEGNELYKKLYPPLPISRAKKQ